MVELHGGKNPTYIMCQEQKLFTKEFYSTLNKIHKLFFNVKKKNSPCEWPTPSTLTNLKLPGQARFSGDESCPTSVSLVNP